MKLYSTVIFVGDGVTKEVRLPFEIIDGDAISVVFSITDDQPNGRLENGVYPLYIFDQAPIAGNKVIIRRLANMSTVPHTFHYTGNAKGGAEFSAKNMDDNFEHITRASQDAMDSQTLVGIDMQEIAAMKEDIDRKAHRVDEQHTAVLQASAAVATDAAEVKANTIEVRGLVDGFDLRVAQGVQTIETTKTKAIEEVNKAVVEGEKNIDEYVNLKESQFQDSVDTLITQKTAEINKTTQDNITKLDNKYTELSNKLQVDISYADETLANVRSAVDGIQLETSVLSESVSDLKSDTTKMIKDLGTAGDALQTVYNSTIPNVEAATAAAEESARNAKESETKAASSVRGIDDKVAAASLSASSAAASATEAGSKATSASNSATVAGTQAQRAVDAADRAEVVLEVKADKIYVNTELSKKWNIQETVGNSNGKVMREGSYGLGATTVNLATDEQLESKMPTGFYKFDAKNTSLEKPFGYGTMLSFAYLNQNDRMAQIAVGNTGAELSFRGTQNTRSWTKVLHSRNTAVDKNGVIHEGTKTPLDTLNVSDLTDHIQAGLNQPVTSSAVKGELDKKADKTELDTKADKAELIKKWDVQVTKGSGAILRENTDYQSNSGGFWAVQAPEYWLGLTFGGSGSDTYTKIFATHSENATISFVKAWQKRVKWGFFYTSNNVLVDGNGFLKKASPTIRLFSNSIEYSGNFEKTPKLEKCGVGIYKIINTLGLAEGKVSGDWYIELPKNRYGDPYFNVEYERTPDGVVLRVYERIELYVPSDRVIYDRKGNLVEVKEKLVLNGDLIDLQTEWRCIDLRFKEEVIEDGGEESGFSDS